MISKVGHRLLEGVKQLNRQSGDRSWDPELLYQPFSRVASIKESPYEGATELLCEIIWVSR